MLDAVILMPVYNDWECFSLLMPRLDCALAGAGLRAEVLVVDDASTLQPPEEFLSHLPVDAISRVRILELSRNCGHQRAITLGLAYLNAQEGESPVVVMDADGEDDPADIPRLLTALGAGRKIVFAQREKRSEGWVFSVFYLLYRKLFATLIGRNVQFGNFSAIPRSLLRRVVFISEIWNHFAIGILKAKVPFAMVSTKRAKRIVGQSKMNFIALVMHGMSAISIYGDVIGVRALVLTCLLAISFIVAALAAAGVRLMTDLAVPGWATYVVALAIILSLQFVILAFFFVFLILHSRNSMIFLPGRDYVHFVASVREVRLNESVHLHRVGAASLQLGG